MTDQKSPLTSAMIRQFTQHICNFRGEVEMLEMKMTDLIDFWSEIIDTYDQEKKVLRAKNEQEVVLNKAN